MLSCVRRLALTLSVAASVAAGAQTSVAAMPPMGWNSWDAYGLTITEAQFRANVAVLRDKLLPFGWRYAVIDEGWFFENPEARSTPAKLHYALDRNGRYVPTPLRFPSAGVKPRQSLSDAKLAATIEDTTFAPLGKWVHAQGLLFGIHIVRGIPRASVERNLPVEGSGFRAQDAADTGDACPWDPTNWGVRDTPAGQAWYDSLLRQYAAWGVDLLKVDCISDHPYKADEIRMIRKAIDRAGRRMVLSLSPGPTSPTHAAEVASLANMWRISDDVWDVWQSAPGKNFPQSITGQFARAADWSVLDFQAGQWPDFDMLPLGELRPSPGWGKARSTSLTPDEQRTMLTLWAINRSPLILGANLTLLDDATLRLLTNRDVIRIDQDGGGRAGPVAGVGSATLRVWASTLGPKRTGHVAALFNLGDVPVVADETLRDLGLVTASGSATASVLNAWTGQTLGRIRRVQVTIPPHGCILLVAR